MKSEKIHVMYQIFLSLDMLAFYKCCYSGLLTLQVVEFFRHFFSFLCLIFYLPALLSKYISTDSLSKSHVFSCFQLNNLIHFPVVRCIFGKFVYAISDFFLEEKVKFFRNVFLFKKKQGIKLLSQKKIKKSKNLFRL